MAKFALSCLALVALAALDVEANLLDSRQWKEVDQYAKANNDFDGHSLVEWYNAEFKDASAKRYGDTKLRNILEMVVTHVSANKPEDCNAEHLKTLPKFEKEGTKVSIRDGRKYKNLVQIYMVNLRKYSRLCQLRIENDYEEAVKTLDSTQLELVKRFTKTTVDQDGGPDEYMFMVNAMDSVMLKHYYLKSGVKIENYDKKTLTTACKNYLSAIGELFKLLEDYSWNARLTGYVEVDGVEESRWGFISKAFCKTFLQQGKLGKAIVFTDTLG